LSSPPVQSAYPVVEVDVDHCTGCGLCVDVCPAGALALAETVAVEPRRCSGCGLCVGACPAGALALVTRLAGAPVRGTAG
jgi:ferredoxin